LRSGKATETSYGNADRKCPVGLFTIIEEKNSWGRFKSGAGWIPLSKTEKCDEEKCLWVVSGRYGSQAFLIISTFV